MLSITRTATHLGVPKPKLYRLLKTENISTVQHGVRKLISRDDIEKLAAVIDSERAKKSEEELLFSSEPVLETSSKNSNRDSSRSSADEALVQKLISEKDRQITRLEELLDKANVKNDRLFEGVIGLQRQMDSLNQRLLLQAPDSKQEPHAESINLKRTFEDAEEVVIAEDKVDSVMREKSSRGFATTLIWILVGLLGLATLANFTGFQLAEKFGEKLNHIVVIN